MVTVPAASPRADPDTGAEGVASGPTVAAAIDVGANSVHLVVAVVADHRLQPLVDESVLLGLGGTVDRAGHLGHIARGELVAALVRYTDAARRLGASTIAVVGTEPMRRAADAPRAIHDVERAADVALHVLEHEEEGWLTLIGVTGGRPLTAETLVMDVGGGSSELVLGGPGRVRATGLALGAARLTSSLVHHDPPTRRELDALRAAARERLREAPDGRPRDVVAVGGTSENLLRVLPAAALDRTLTRARIAEAVDILATEPAELAAERHAVNVTRARILPAGAAILDAVLERYGLERLRVSEAGIREGAILASGHAGREWRDMLATLASGWR
jgi:exopolyphosphatase/pppGpp-phosphohydrolase